MHFQPQSFLKSLALFSAISVFSAVAHATSITYNLIGVSTAAGNLTGTVTIDPSSDLVTSSNITLHNTSIGDPVFNLIGSQAAWSGQSQNYISSGSNYPLQYWGGQFELRFDTADIGNGTSLLQFCLVGGVCGTNLSRFSQVDLYTGAGTITAGVTSGALSPMSAVVSEPSSLVLLGTGIFGVAALAYRRFARPLI